MDSQPVLRVNPNVGGDFFLRSITEHVAEQLADTNLIELGVCLLLAGVTAFFLAALYRRFSRTVSNRDSFAGLFPLITIATATVIFVIKTSLALSLGLVGALSIVRFRAAIKEPEELIYLFMCIALGLAFGAGKPVIAMTGLVFFTIFVTVNQYKRKRTRHNLMFNLVSDTDGFFARNRQEIEKILASHCEQYAIHRADMDDEQLQLSVTVLVNRREAVVEMLSGFRNTGCRVSYINLDDNL